MSDPEGTETVDETINRLHAEVEQWKTRFEQESEAFAAEHAEVERLHALFMERAQASAVRTQMDGAEIERLRAAATETLERLSKAWPYVDASHVQPLRAALAEKMPVLPMRDGDLAEEEA